VTGGQLIERDNPKICTVATGTMRSAGVMVTGGLGGRGISVIDLQGYQGVYVQGGNLEVFGNCAYIMNGKWETLPSWWAWPGHDLREPRSWNILSLAQLVLHRQDVPS